MDLFGPMHSRATFVPKLHALPNRICNRIGLVHGARYLGYAKAAWRRTQEHRSYDTYALLDALWDAGVSLGCSGTEEAES